MAFRQSQFIHITLRMSCRSVRGVRKPNLLTSSVGLSWVSLPPGKVQVICLCLWHQAPGPRPSYSEHPVVGVARQILQLFSARALTADSSEGLLSSGVVPTSETMKSLTLKEQ